jgi:hypothetical protein
MEEHVRVERDEQQIRIAVHPIPLALAETHGLGECWLARRFAVDL